MSAAKGEKDERQKGQEGPACLPPVFRVATRRLWPNSSSHDKVGETREMCAAHSTKITNLTPIFKNTLRTALFFFSFSN